MSRIYNYPKSSIQKNLPLYYASCEKNKLHCLLTNNNCSLLQGILKCTYGRKSKLFLSYLWVMWHTDTDEEQELHSNRTRIRARLITAPASRSTVHVSEKLAKISPLQCIRTATGWQKQHLKISLASQIPKMPGKGHNQMNSAAACALLQLRNKCQGHEEVYKTLWEAINTTKKFESF